MANFDDQLSRMNYLMEFKMAPKGVSSNIEYCTTGADGKVYGILKEGTKYYIKTTESGKENISESYSYINGFMSKKENEFKSYNDATKHLELKLMALNESLGKHEDVSVVDFNKSEKVFATLTEDARVELDRIKQIMENCENCGKPQTNIGKGPGDGFPFDKGTEANMNFSGSKETSAENVNKQDGYKDASKNVEQKLESDKMAKGGTDEPKGKDATCDLDGTCVATEKPKDGKVVKVNEGLDFDTEEENIPGQGANYNEDVMEPDEDITDDEFEEIPLDDDVQPEGNEIVGVGDDLNGTDSYEDKDLDELMEELENCSNDDAFTGPTADNNTPEPKKTVSMAEAPTVVSEENEYPGEVHTGEEALGTEPHKANTISMAEPPSKAKMNESKIRSIVEGVCRELIAENKKKKVNESVEEKINRIVKEEVTKLNVWGQHPSYRKQPMTTPPNKEVKAGTADHDWNDDSVKGEQPYGQKIGSSFPFDKTVEMLTDNVLSQLKESFLKKK